MMPETCSASGYTTYTLRLQSLPTRIKGSTSPRVRLVMAHVRQLRWTRGYDRWSHSQDFTDFDQCIWDPRIAHEILWTKKKPAVLQMVMFKWRAAPRLLAFAKCPHIEGSIVGACNHAVSFPKCGLELFPWWRLFGYFPGCKLIPSAAYRPGLKLLLQLPKSNSWQRTWLHRYVSARHVAGGWRGGRPATPIASSSIALPLFSPWITESILPESCFEYVAYSLVKESSQKEMV